MKRSIDHRIKIIHNKEKGEPGMDDIELTTMCAVFRGQYVLMINRVKTWKGWAFLGGHLEQGESVIACVERELEEEAGIVLCRPEFKGITNIYNTVNHKRHIIYNFTCREYQGSVNTYCDEGEIQWMKVSKLETLDMAEGMEYRIPLFVEDKVQELYIEWDEECGYTKVKYSEM